MIILYLNFQDLFTYSYLIFRARSCLQDVRLGHAFNMLFPWFETLSDTIVMVLIQDFSAIYGTFRTKRGLDQSLNNGFVNRRSYLLTHFLSIDISDQNIGYYYYFMVYLNNFYL